MKTTIPFKIHRPKAIQLDTSCLQLGINNNQIDVVISPKFRHTLRSLIRQLVKQEAALKPEYVEHHKAFIALRESYVDMMTILIRRSNTDLNSNQVNVLQFAVPKFVLLSIKQSLDTFINHEREKSNELRIHGSSQSLAIHEHLVWLSTNFNTIYYEITKQVFSQLRQVERKKMAHMREQYLSSSSPENIVGILYNPMLMARELHLPTFLLDQHFCWQGGSDNNELININNELESLLQKQFKDVTDAPLKKVDRRKTTRGDPFDILDGLSLIKHYLGPVIETTKSVCETLGPLDDPNNMSTLFNISQHKILAAKIRKNNGIKAWYSSTKRMKKLSKIRNKIHKLITLNKTLAQFVASDECRQFLNMRMKKKLSPSKMCQYISGLITEKQLVECVTSGYELTKDEISSLKNAAKNTMIEVQQHPEEVVNRLLIAVSNYRLQLIQYRFSHRIFSQLAILSKDDDIELSKQASSLYQLPSSSELATDSTVEENRIIHHSVLKVNLEGVNHLIKELDNQKLKPATFFKRHFYQPVSQLLSKYNANKISIESDAMALSIYENADQQKNWQCISYSCGLAREIHDILKVVNRRAHELNLPALELNISIAYADSAPDLLYDEEHELINSKALTQARDNAISTKGILLHPLAFEKLEKEISLTLYNIIVDNYQLALYYAEYRDMQGKKQEVVIRKHRPEVKPLQLIDQKQTKPNITYKVITNNQIISILKETVLQHARKIATNTI